MKLVIKKLKESLSRFELKKFDKSYVLLCMTYSLFKSIYGPLKIINVLRRFIVVQGLKLSVFMNLPLLSGQFIRFGCRPLKGYCGVDRPRIWMLGKEGLIQDFTGSLAGDHWNKPYDFPRDIPKVVARNYLPLGVDDNTYANLDKKIEQVKDDYMEAWRSIIKGLPNSARPDAITTANFGYYAERELARACELENIPFIAMHKECLKSNGRLEFFKVIYQRRGKFEGRKILVYNDRERKLQIDSGVARSDQVVVCGMPRLDRLHRWRETGIKRPERPRTLMALGFTEKTGLPRIPRKCVEGGGVRFEYLEPEHENMGWFNLFLNYHETLVKIARDNPQWVVQLKLKARRRDAEPSVSLMKKLKAPENLQIIVGEDPLKFLQGADVVTGFNTTAVLEGLAAGLPVVTPQFDEVLQPNMCDFAATFERATYTPDDPASFYAVLSELMNDQRKPQRDLSTPVLETLDMWVGNPDGKSGQRVQQAFLQEIARGK